MTAVTAMYKSVQMASDAMMPMGMSRAGFFVSSAAVATESTPRYAKKMTAAPAETPAKPNGMNGSQFVTSTDGPARNRKIKIASNLTATSALLTVTLSWTPRIKRNVRNSVMRMAGRFTSPPSAGTIVNACGNSISAVLRRPTTYADHPPATADAPTEYSSTRFQPTSHAKSSPTEV